MLMIPMAAKPCQVFVHGEISSKIASTVVGKFAAVCLWELAQTQKLQLLLRQLATRASVPQIELCPPSNHCSSSTVTLLLTGHITLCQSRFFARTVGRLERLLASQTS
jgi:hypothetical protein